MERLKDIKELRKEFKNTTSGWSKDTIFVAKAVMFLCDLFSQPTTKRPQSEWNKFFSAGMKKGKTARQVADEWKARRR